MSSVRSFGHEVDVVLRDSTIVHVRPVRHEDEERLVLFRRSLSEESLARRFFTPAVDLPAVARRECSADPARVFRLIGTVGKDEQVVADAAYYILERGRAEIALAIADEYQGRGLGSVSRAKWSRATGE